MSSKTLAERIIAHTPLNRGVEDFIQGLAFWDYLKRGLDAKPLCVLHVQPNTVERFVFDFSPISLVDDMVEDKLLTKTMVRQFSRVPTDKMWFEFNLDRGAVGVLVVIDAGRVHVIIAGDSHGGPVAFGAFTAQTFPWPQQLRCDSIWVAFKDKQRQILKLAIDIVEASLFLLNVPRLCEIRTSKGGRTAAQGQHRDYPPVEIKRVVMTLGRGNPRYERGPQRAGETDEAYRRRLHHVIGHFRTYTKRQTTPKIVWINEQWRGDPSRGIIIRETHFKPPESTK